MRSFAPPPPPPPPPPSLSLPPSLPHLSPSSLSLSPFKELIPSSLLEVLNHTEFGDAEIITMAIQIAHAIDYLHTHGVLHCDIGARNISTQHILHNHIYTTYITSLTNVLYKWLCFVVYWFHHNHTFLPPFPSLPSQDLPPPPPPPLLVPS